MNFFLVIYTYINICKYIHVYYSGGYSMVYFIGWRKNGSLESQGLEGQAQKRTGTHSTIVPASLGIESTMSRLPSLDHAFNYAQLANSYILGRCL